MVSKIHIYIYVDLNKIIYLSPSVSLEKKLNIQAEEANDSQELNIVDNVQSNRFASDSE